jgi:hypothetical protein
MERGLVRLVYPKTAMPSPEAALLVGSSAAAWSEVINEPQLKAIRVESWFRPIPVFARFSTVNLDSSALISALDSPSGSPQRYRYYLT